MGQDGWQWQGRQGHGWFGHGTKPQDGLADGGRGGAYGSAPATLDERIRALGHAAIAGLPASKRYHSAASFDGPALERLVGAMRAWVGGPGTWTTPASPRASSTATRAAPWWGTCAARPNSSGPPRIRSHG